MTGRPRTNSTTESADSISLSRLKKGKKKGEKNNTKKKEKIRKKSARPFDTEVKSCAPALAIASKEGRNQYVCSPSPSKIKKITKLDGQTKENGRGKSSLFQEHPGKTPPPPRAKKTNPRNL